MITLKYQLLLLLFFPQGAKKSLHDVHIVIVKCFIIEKIQEIK